MPEFAYKRYAYNKKNEKRSTELAKIVKCYCKSK